LKRTLYKLFHRFISSQNKIICFYKGDTVTIKNELYPIGNFQVVGISNDNDNNLTLFFKIFGTFVYKENLLYPLLDGEYSYESLVERNLFEVEEETFYPVDRVNYLLNTYFLNDKYHDIFTENNENLEEIEDFYDELIHKCIHDNMTNFDLYELYTIFFNFGRRNDYQLNYRLNDSLEYNILFYPPDDFNINDYYSDNYYDLLKLIRDYNDSIADISFNVDNDDNNNIIVNYSKPYKNFEFEDKELIINFGRQKYLENFEIKKFFENPVIDNYQFNFICELHKLKIIYDKRIDTFELLGDEPYLKMRIDYEDFLKTVTKYKWFYRYKLENNINKKLINWYSNFKLKGYEHLDFTPKRGISTFLSIPDRLFVKYRENGYIYAIYDFQKLSYNEILRSKFYNDSFEPIIKNFNDKRIMKIFNNSGKELFTKNQYGDDYNNYSRYLTENINL